MSNLSSVLKAVEYVAPNDNVIVSSSLKEINDADKIIFPGQGAAKKCMSSINDKNLVSVIKKNSIEKPFLGICMGMQVLMDFDNIPKNTLMTFDALSHEWRNWKLPKGVDCELCAC